MTTKIESRWQELLRETRSKPIETNGYHLIRLSAETRFDIYAGIDASGFVLLAIGVPVRPPNISLCSSSLDYFRQKRDDGRWLMVLRLHESGLEPVFGRLAQDLVDASDGVSDENGLVELFKERLNLWKRLFQLGGSGLLQPHEIKGLVAEMLVLESLILCGTREICETVTAWRGPLKADQDFLFSDVSIEVKAIGPGSEVVSISSLKQLESSVPMHLIVVTLRQATAAEPGAIGLNAMSARIEGLIAANPEALKTFKDLMLEAGYVEHEFYDTILFEPISRDSYHIAEGFPRLLPSAVPAGIINASYDIGIGDISEFKEEFLP